LLNHPILPISWRKSASCLLFRRMASRMDERQTIHLQT
jgi:hypothetical protein